jgi:hypothetical protein
MISNYKPLTPPDRKAYEPYVKPKYVSDEPVKKAKKLPFYLLKPAKPKPLYRVCEKCHNLTSLGEECDFCGHIHTINIYGTSSL